MAETRVALVTGASRGIGLATAIELASRGYALAISSVDEGELSQAAAAIGASGARVFSMPGDLADLAFAESFVSQSAATLGDPHVLVNNAAWRELKTMREISPDSWEKTLRVCLTAPAFLARWAAARMEPRGRGVIVNVSSIMATRGAGLAPAYVAAKGGLDALTYELAALYGRSGVRVLSVQPGAIDTALSADVAGADSDANVLRDWSEEMIGLGRWGTAQEIARTIAWLAGDDASYLTGTTIRVDGGWTRQLYPQGIKHHLRPDQFEPPT